MDIPEELKTTENVQVTQKPRRIFTDEQKAEEVQIINKSDKSIHQVAEEMGLSESALRRWIKQAQIDEQPASAGELTSPERKELIALRRDLKRAEMERDFLTFLFSGRRQQFPIHQHFHFVPLQQVC